MENIKEKLRRVKRNMVIGGLALSLSGCSYDMYRGTNAFLEDIFPQPRGETMRERENKQEQLPQQQQSYQQISWPAQNEQPEKKVLGKTPYSFAFKRVVEKHGTPSIVESDEFEERTDEIRLSQDNKIYLSTRIDDHMGDYVAMQIYSSNATMPTFQSPWEKISSDSCKRFYKLTREDFEKGAIRGKAKVSFKVKKTPDQEMEEETDYYYIYINE